jgi:two-component system, OmpR family, phosphate regulon sensor histidine kinase PhoR
LRHRLFLKVFLAFLLVIVTTAVMMDLLVLRGWKKSLRHEVETALGEKTALAALRVNRSSGGQDHTELAAQIAKEANARVTLVDAAGRVLADTGADPRAMENHASRPEFKAAFAGKRLIAARWSHTAQENFLYAAAPVQFGAVRLAVPLKAIEATVMRVRRVLALVTLLAIGIAAVLAALFSNAAAKRLERVIAFSENLASGDLSARLPLVKDELGALASSLNKTAENLQKSFAEIRQIEGYRRDLVANVSHELRTPLTAIQGFTETLLQPDLPPDEQRRFLEIIQRNVVSMARLSGDLLLLAELESREHPLSLQATPASQLVTDALVEWEGRVQGVALIVEQSAPRSVLADAEFIAQVFRNLIENALRYGAHGGRVEIGAREADGGVEFSVRDFGEGIPQEHLPRLFERFYRVDKARSRALGGTGLGLSIVKHIIALHGGSVRVESTVGKGSAFFFVLPCAYE